MRREAPYRPVPAADHPLLSALGVFALSLLFSVGGTSVPAAARQVNQEFSPASGPAQVIAQGVVEVPAGDAGWRTVRMRALTPEDAPPEARPLGFVLASSGPLLLVDQETGEQVRLGTGEAALVPAGTIQRRSSLGPQPVSYLSIELVPIDAPAPPAEGTVLHLGQGFSAPGGLRDLDLLSAILAGDESFTVPDSGADNVILITKGVVNIGRPGSAPVVLLAGEAEGFIGELQVAGAPGDDQSEAVSFVVAMIGPEVPPPGIPLSSSETETSSTEVPPAAATGQRATAGEVST
jgi:hypothetical protein